MNMDNKLLYRIFDPQILDAHSDEWGVVIHCPNPDAIGFATTLTPAVIKLAIAQNINLLVTHHDVWDFMLEEKSICHELLNQHRISHVWCHSPLDAADFGTAAALLAAIDCKPIGNIAGGDGRFGDLPKPLQLSEVTHILDEKLLESPCRKNDANKLITRVACVTGAGSKVSYLSEALTFAVDLYITGETSMYLLEYANFRKVNALVYSHNYTEILGTHNFADRVASQLEIKKVTRLVEPHF
jgi:putative NIF3 family GTP cyclohydrolase 1 type 2